jgi:hypothetical protein
MCRVTRPGGRVVVAESDSETRVQDAPDRELTRRILTQFHEQFPNRQMGRQLPCLFKQAGLTEVSVHPHTVFSTEPASGFGRNWIRRAVERAEAAGVVAEEEASTWLGQPQEAERAGHIFAALTCFVVSGRKPSGPAR